MTQPFTLFGVLLCVSTAALAQVPTITAVSPTANALTAARTSPLTVTFSQSLTSGSAAALKVYSAQRGGLRTRGATPAVVSGNTLRFTPAASYLPGETVMSTITTAAASTGGRLAKARVVQFTTATGGTGQANFQPGSEVTVGANPNRVVLGDVDGDGDLDLLVSSRTDGTVSVRLNGGNATGSNIGTFSNGSTVDVGAVPDDLAIGDVDGDGDLDFVVSNETSRAASVLLNNGLGSFTRGNVVTVEAYPGSVALGDADGDGDLDLFVANSISNSVSIRFNGGNATGSNTGTFSGGSEVLTGLNPKGLAVGDIDGDGDLDMAVTTQRPFNSNSFGGFSTTLVNNGAGTYTRGEPIYTGSYASFEQVFGDLDKDGDLDLLVTIGEGNLVAVLVNGGDNRGSNTGSFYYQYSVSVGNSPGDVALGDVDSDGDVDLLTVNSGDNSVSVRLNDGKAGYNTNPLSSGSEVSVGASPSSLVLGDVDGDGDLDVVTTNYGQPRGTSRPGTTVSVRLNQPQVPIDLVVSTTATIPAGTYNSITVTSTGAGTLGGNVTVNTSLSVQSGGTLTDACAVISGAGSFVLAAGATLGICAAQGISSNGAIGAVQVTGLRSFSPDASYVYNGTAAQVTGSALPVQVRNLTTINTKDVTLSQGVAIAQVLTIGDRGNLLQPSAAASVTLLSDATAGTALMVNRSSGTLQGPTTTIQRAIDGSTNAGSGYRHFAPPVYGATIGSLTTTGFTPVVNSLYNTQGGSVQPFPTVYFYEESRVNDTGVPGSGFDKGWVSPDDLTDQLFNAQGYTLQLPATAKLSVTGRVFDNGGVGNYVYRTGSDTDAGWSLVGNPYPSPIDWSLVTASDRTGLDAAMYVFESTGPYSGSYRSYANGIGGNSIIPLGQAFFVRVSSGQTQGLMFFKGSQRVTTFNTTSFKRTTADPRPQLALRLSGATLHDITYLYQEDGATPGVDPDYDAVKMPNSNGLNVSQLATTARLAINGLPALTAATSVQLVVGVPAAGTYTLALTTLSNLPAGLDAYLRDVQTGQTVKLAVGSSYRFDVTAPQAATPVLGRFTLLFSPATPLATAPALAPELVGIYPNPAHGSFTVTVPAVAGATQVHAELVNTLGQVIRHQAAALPASGTSFSVPTAELAAGVYVLRLQAGATTLAKRVVVQ